MAEIALRPAVSSPEPEHYSTSHDDALNTAFSFPAQHLQYTAGSNGAIEVEDLSQPRAASALAPPTLSARRCFNTPAASLPAFTFHSSHTSRQQWDLARPETPPALLPLSSRSLPGTPTRGHGHRRTNSGYIGSNVLSGGAGIPSSSPTKSTFGTLPDQGPSRKRGHGHRRSAALSSQDVASFASQLSSDSENPMHPIDHHDPLDGEAGASEPKTGDKQASTRSPIMYEDQHVLSTPPHTPSRHRVTRFSDKVDIIPRPLSYASSESSATTIKGHRASESMTSLDSALKSMVDLSPSPGRPTQRASSVPSSPVAAKMPATDEDVDFFSVSRPATAPEADSHNHKSQLSGKVGAWASSLKVKKQRGVVTENKYTASDNITPDGSEDIGVPSDLLSTPPRDELSGSPDDRTPNQSFPSFTIDSEAWNQASHRQLSVVDNDESQSSLIDLDSEDGVTDPAARFFFPDFDKTRPQGFSASRRSMHSSGVVSGFMGPNSNYHRRATSAPVMPPPAFERQDFQGLQHEFASGKGFVMEDVFEEEEDEEEDEESDEQQEEVVSGARSRAAISAAYDQGFLAVTTCQSETNAQTSDSHSGSSNSTIQGLQQLPRQSVDIGSDTSTNLAAMGDFMSDRNTGTSSLSSRPASLTGDSSFDTPQLPSQRSSLTGYGKFAPHSMLSTLSIDQMQSQEDVPSLVSSLSTATGPTSKTNSSNRRIPPTPDRNVSMTSLAGGASLHKKRSSIASLSHFLRLHNHSRNSVDHLARATTSDGIHVDDQNIPEKKRTGFHALKRLWKSKGTTT